ncbi:MAG TPA: CBS domain-containing protein, partial [Euryarchaeota archaeon]|nr:CBS domain-containing protein [Euryarchaeota archaeon]
MRAVFGKILYIHRFKQNLLLLGIFNMQVKDIMTEEVICTEVPGRSDQALNLIIKHNVTGLPVIKKGTKELMGIVSKTDFSRNPDEGQLALLMTKNVITTTPDTDVKSAVKTLLVAGVKRLPVIDGEKNIVGIVTSEDLVWKAVSKLNTDEKVTGYMMKSFTAVWKDTPLKVASEIMRLSGSRALLVLDSNAKLYGVLTDTDMLRVAQLTESTKKSEMSGGTEGDSWGWDSKNIIYITKRRLEVPDKTVGDIISENVITATKGTKVADCAKKMSQARIELVPVIDA